MIIALNSEDVWANFRLFPATIEDGTAASVILHNQMKYIRKLNCHANRIFNKTYNQLIR